MQIKPCSTADCGQLAAMNKRLIEDEQSTNPMSVSQLEERMHGFLTGEYSAFYFLEEKTVIGYALVRHTADPLYLRQFFIDREYRRKHYGTRAFQLLMKHLQTDSIDIDVLPWNARGMAFWQSCGFRETCISMRLQ